MLRLVPLALLVGCHSPVALAPASAPLPDNYEIGKVVSSRQCQPFLFAAIPIGPSLRGHELRDLAQGDADALIEVTVDKTTIFWLIGYTNCFTLRGTRVTATK